MTFPSALLHDLIKKNLILSCFGFSYSLFHHKNMNFTECTKYRDPPNIARLGNKRYKSD